MQARRLVGVAERIVLGAGMSLALWLGEWLLRRTQRRSDAKSAAPPPQPAERVEPQGPGQHR